ncbi:MAG: prepilin-type N-terminal cleavage/methylation domain-containing protein, partial [Thermodesulfovibrionia bacterium]|nr:prepilin-type N-terminal cleavage/methylation domain-containing protein [Thermodesulfovibrionia bacterium]
MLITKCKLGLQMKNLKRRWWKKGSFNYHPVNFIDRKNTKKEDNMYKAINNIREQKGFTLIELLIVVAIIG